MRAEILDINPNLYYIILELLSGSAVLLVPAISFKTEVYIMAYVISDSCISCGSCASQCPVEAISQGDSQYEIDAAKCIDCGSCASQCPVSAISQG